MELHGIWIGSLGATVKHPPAESEKLEAYGINIHRNYAADIKALVSVGFMAPGRKDLPPHPIRLPFDWHADPFGDRNWMFHLHAWRMLDPHLNRLLREPDPSEAFADVSAVLADWHRGNILSRPGPFTWYDMSTGLRALKLAFLMRLAVRRNYAFPDSAMMADLVDRHIAELCRPEELNPGNHGLFQLNGLMALSWQIPAHPRASQACAYATDRMGALLDAQLGPRGVHTEDSPDYHFFAIKLITRILDAPWWRIAAMDPFRAKLAAAQDARYWLVDPAGRCLPVGDSTDKVRVKKFDGLRRWPHTRRGAVLGAAVDGYAVVRTDPAVPVDRSAILFLTASFHLETHKHADCLSVIWQEAGENLLIDSGKYGYQQDRMQDYFQSSRAHNTLEIDGSSFSRKTAHAYGSGIKRVAALERTWTVEAEADHASKGVRHRRCVFFRPHHFMLAVDHVTAVRSASRLTRLRQAVRRRCIFASWWHFNPAHTVASAPGPDGRHAVSGLAKGRQLRVSHVSTGLEPRAELHQGEMRPRVHGWVSRDYRQYEPAPALGFLSRGRLDYFAAALFELVGPESAPRLDLRGVDGGGRIMLAEGQGTPKGARNFAFGPFAMEIAETLL
jgi:uncharacterized protein (DUF1499 family)